MATSKISIRTHAKQINHLAWGVRRSHGLTWRQAFHHAVKALTMKESLSNGIVNFSFKKVSDGSIRAAKGTRSLEVIPTELHPKGTSTKPETTNVVTYFDIDSNGWRSFDISNLIPSL